MYEISHQLKEQGTPLSPTAVREVLKIEGFAPLPRRADDERPQYPRATIEVLADVRQFTLHPRRFITACGGLFLFVPDLVRLDVGALAQRAGLPGSRLIPAAQALRASLALKLWSIERKSHVMALVRIPMKSDTDSDLIRTGFRPMSDSVPELSGQGSDGIRTAFRNGSDSVPIRSGQRSGVSGQFPTALSRVGGRDREEDPLG